MREHRRKKESMKWGYKADEGLQAVGEGLERAPGNAAAQSH